MQPPDDVSEHAELNYRRNLSIWTLHGVLCMANLLFWPLTVATSFGQMLLDRTWVPAAMSIAFWLGSYLPQIFVAVWGDRLPTRKQIYSASGYGMGAFMAALGVYLWVRGPQAPAQEVLAATLACVALACFAMGVSVIPCWDLYSRIIPPDRRGRALGVVAAANIVPTLAYGWLVLKMTGEAPPLDFPRNYAVLALGAAAGLCLAATSVLFLREKPYPVEKGATLGSFLRRFAALRTDRRLLRFLPVLAGMNVVIALGTYYTSFLQKSVPTETLAIAQGVQFAFYAITAQVFGRCADRWGFKPVIVAVALAAAGTAAMCAVAADVTAVEGGAPSTLWRGWVVAAFLGGASLVMLHHYAKVQYTLLLAPRGKAHLYLAATNLPMCIVVLGAPLLGRWVVDAFGFGVLFAGLAVVSLLVVAGAAALLVHVKADQPSPCAR